MVKTLGSQPGNESSILSGSTISLIWIHEGGDTALESVSQCQTTFGTTREFQQCCLSVMEAQEFVELLALDRYQ